MSAVTRIVTDREFHLHIADHMGREFDVQPETALVAAIVLGYDVTSPEWAAFVEAKEPPELCIVCRDRLAHVYVDFCSVCAPDPLDRSAL